MSKHSFTKLGSWILLPALLVLAGGAAWRPPGPATTLPGDAGDIFRAAVRIPPGRYATGSREPGCHPPGHLELGEFYLWPVEVPRSWWRVFRPDDEAGRGDPDEPAAPVSQVDAVAFCAWFSARYDVRARLPTVDEWQVAARAGVNGLVYPWGWAQPEGRALFDAPAAGRIAAHPPNEWGLYAMAGNVAEWTQAGHDASGAAVMGGSWSERNPAFLRISHRLYLPVTYAGRDVGFRIAIDPPTP